MLSARTIAHAREGSPGILLRRLHTASLWIPETSANYRRVIDAFVDIEHRLEERTAGSVVHEEWEKVFGLLSDIPQEPWVHRVELFIADEPGSPDP
ncbi:MAG: hypothetical protein JWM39_407 [Parcubacteria group bacterium]|nr:hypothetical protein [Parcubacteria group bacterium]